MTEPKPNRFDRSDEEWRAELSAQEYQICRLKGTERPFTGALYTETRPGKYLCRCCGAALFDAQTKYDSGSGWPSFYAPAAEAGIDETRDTSLGMIRTEICCARCDSHLGHLFPDGPEPTGLRYCVNSASLTFTPEGE